MFLWLEELLLVSLWERPLIEVLGDLPKDFLLLLFNVFLYDEYEEVSVGLDVS
jgi:hypothetical protein